MTPYYDEAGITIYHGDCRDVLLDVELPGYVAVITDPPYGIINRFGAQWKPNGLRTLQFAFDNDGVDEIVVLGIAAAAKDAKSIFTFCGYDTVGMIQDILRGLGYTPKPFAWIKLCPPPALPGNWWPSGFEIAIYAYRSGAWFGDESTKRRNTWFGDSLRHGNNERIGHPTQKPINLMTHIVQSMVPEHGCALDPFMGSGTTLVAAKQLHRKAIGIEVEERYCEMAATRLAQGVLPFGEKDQS